MLSLGKNNDPLDGKNVLLFGNDGEISCGRIEYTRYAIYLFPIGVFDGKVNSCNPIIIADITRSLEFNWGKLTHWQPLPENPNIGDENDEH